MLHSVLKGMVKGMENFFLKLKRLFLANKQMTLVYAICLFLCIALIVILTKSCSEDGSVVIADPSGTSGFSGTHSSENSGAIEQGAEQPETPAVSESKDGEGSGSLSVSDELVESDVINFEDFFNQSSNSSQSSQSQAESSQQSGSQQTTPSSSTPSSSSPGLEVKKDTDTTWGKIQ